MAKLFIPGPTDVDQQTLEAQTRPMIGHRSQEFQQLFTRLQPRLKQVFQTQNRVFVVASSGTGLWEGLLRNSVLERALICSCGAFGERWLKVATANGIDFDSVLSEWGSPNTAEQVEAALKRGHFDTLAIVHNETSTGIENPIQEIAERARGVQENLVILVDAVSSAGGVDIRPDEWGLDIVMASSQKCFALPPGLAFAATSDRALRRASQIENRGWYFDLVMLEEYLQQGYTPATPALSLLYALDVKLDRILQEGIEARFERHLQLATLVHGWADDWFANLGSPAFRSKTVTCVKNTRGIAVPDLMASLAGQGMWIANGYGKLRDQTFRIGHLGETTPEELQALLTAIEQYLAEPAAGGMR
jgi:aspartate aminotransferase-like enzyme